MSTTPNYGWAVPTVGGDNNTWGTELVSLFTAQDATVKANDAAAQGYATTAQGNSLQKAQNLADLANIAAAWTSLGVVINSTANGYWAQIGPILVQWGNIVGTAGTYTLPKAFSSLTGAKLIAGNSDAGGADNDVAYGSLASISTYTAKTKASTGNANSGYGVSWFAIGPA